MGCDIHMHLELKVGDSPWQADKYHTITEETGYKYLDSLPFSGRNYQLFAKLAGVRGSGPDAKGLPDDCSNIIKEYTGDIDDYSDYHSHSYSSLKEFKQALNECGYDFKKVKDYKKLNLLEDNIEYADRYIALIAYVEQQIERYKLELEGEKHLLQQDINTEVQARLVYWFDN